MTADEKNAADRQLLLAFAPLHRSALGEACGVVGGVILAAATLVLVLRGGYPEPNLGLLSQFFWGYSTGFTLGWGFAVVRNAVVWAWLMVIRSRAEMDQYSDFLDHL